MSQTFICGKRAIKNNGIKSINSVILMLIQNTMCTHLFVAKYYNKEQLVIQLYLWQDDPTLIHRDDPDVGEAFDEPEDGDDDLEGHNRTVMFESPPPIPRRKASPRTAPIQVKKQIGGGKNTKTAPLATSTPGKKLLDYTPKKAGPTAAKGKAKVESSVATTNASKKGQAYDTWTETMSNLTGAISASTQQKSEDVAPKKEDAGDYYDMWAKILANKVRNMPEGNRDPFMVHVDIVALKAKKPEPFEI